MNRSCFSILAAMVLTAAGANGMDWPQLLGPSRNGTTADPIPAKPWPKEGPKVLWHRPIGQGFSGPVVQDHALLIFHRIENEEVLENWDAATATPKWKSGYPTTYRDDFGFDPGPRGTPAISQNMVYTYGAEGMLRCTEFLSGKVVWSVDCRKQFGARKGFFGIGCSPLVEANAVILNIGGRKDAGVVAFDRKTGKTLWQATDDEASYSSPIAGVFQNKRQILNLTRTELVSLAPADGKVLYRFPFSPPIHSSVTAATPLIIGDELFLSASYDLGAVMLRLENNSAKKIWGGEDILSNHYANSVYYDGFLFGLHGRTDPGFSPEASFRCVEARAGKVMWEEKSFGAASLLLAGNELLVLKETGELLRVPASSKAFQTTGRAQVMPNHVRAMPALADGHFFARSADQIFCIDLN